MEDALVDQGGFGVVPAKARGRGQLLEVQAARSGATSSEVERLLPGDHRGEAPDGSIAPPQIALEVLDGGACLGVGLAVELELG